MGKSIKGKIEKILKRVLSKADRHRTSGYLRQKLKQKGYDHPPSPQRIACWAKGHDEVDVDETEKETTLGSKRTVNCYNITKEDDGKRKT